MPYAIRAGVVILIGAIGSAAGSAEADIAGFNNLTGWTYNQPDPGTPADLPNPSTVHLTTGNGQRRSIFFNTPQDITHFTASFTYRAADMRVCLVPQGITFCVQNDPRGPQAIGGGGGGLGYAATVGNSDSIVTSAAVALFTDTGPGITLNGYWTGGNQGGGNQNIAPVNAFAFRDLNISLTYSNPILAVVIDDPLISGSADFTRNYVVGDLASLLGGSTAYVGFTASTGDIFGNGGSNQYLSNFSYTVPSPAAGIVLACGSIALARRRR